MRASHSRLHAAAAVSLIVGTLACGGGQTTTSSASSPTAPSGGKTSGASNGTATLAIHLTDSPFGDASAFLVTFSEVSVHSADTGAWTTLAFSGMPIPTSRTCDLKQLQGGATDLLGTTPLTVGGKYTQIRLTVVSALLYPTSSPPNPPLGMPCISGYTPVGGTSVKIPSGEVKLNQEFTVGAGTTSIMLDFDGDQSVHQTGSGNGTGHGNAGYIMSPVIRIVSVTQS